MTTTPVPTAARDDVEARAREALARGISPYFWDKALDDISEAGGSVSSARRDSLRQADYVMREFPAAGLRIVDAAEDDRRTEALATFRAWAAADERWQGRWWEAEPCIQAFEWQRSAELRRALAPYLRADDTGGEG